MCLATAEHIVCKAAKGEVENQVDMPEVPFVSLGGLRQLYILESRDRDVMLRISYHHKCGTHLYSFRVVLNTANTEVLGMVNRGKVKLHLTIFSSLLMWLVLTKNLRTV